MKPARLLRFRNEITDREHELYDEIGRADSGAVILEINTLKADKARKRRRVKWMLYLGAALLGLGAMPGFTVSMALVTLYGMMLTAVAGQAYGSDRLYQKRLAQHNYAPGQQHAQGQSQFAQTPPGGG